MEDPWAQFGTLVKLDGEEARGLESNLINPVQITMTDALQSIDISVVLPIMEVLYLWKKFKGYIVYDSKFLCST